MLLYCRDTSQRTVGTEVNSKCYNTGRGLSNDTRMPWLLSAECLLRYENNEARHGVHDSHGKGVEVGRWKPASVLEHVGLSKVAGSLLSLANIICGFIQDFGGDLVPEKQVKASLAE